MKSMIAAQGTGNPTANTTNYAQISGAVAWSTTEANATMIMPCDGTITGLHVAVLNAPGAAASNKKHTLFLRSNHGGGPMANTALTCVILETATSAKDDSHSATFSKGDKVSLQCVSNGSTAAVGGMVWTMIIDTGVGGGFPVFFHNGVATGTGTTVFLAPGGGQMSATEALIYAPLAIPGVSTIARNLFVLSDAAMTGIMSWTFTLRCQGDTILTCVLDASNPTTNSDQANQPTLAAGGATSMHVVAANTPSTSRLVASIEIVPTTDGDACLFCSHSSTTAVGTTTYYTGATGSFSSYVTSEALGSPQAILDACVIKALYAILSVAPGSGVTVTETLRVGGADQGINCALTGTGSGAGKTTANGSGSIIVPVDSLVDVSMVPTGGTAALARHQTGLLYNIPTTVAASLPSSPLRAAQRALLNR